MHGCIGQQEAHIIFQILGGLTVKIWDPEQ